MKKSQRARLADLAAKDAATLTAEENAELTTLQAFAAANPDAAKDSADAAPAAAAPSLTDSLRGAFAVLGDKAKLGTDLAQARTRIAELEGQLASAQSTANASDVRAATAEAHVVHVASFFGLSAADLSGKDASAVTALLAKKISDSAVEQLASAGVPAAALPPPTKNGTSGESLEELHAQMAKETDPKQLGVLAQKANALREQQWAGKN